MTSSLSRRRLLGHATAAAGLGLFASGIASRAAASPSSAQAGSLPPVGQTIQLSAKAVGTTLRVDLPPPLPRLDFIGSLVVRIEAGGADFIRHRTLAFTMAAEHPLFGRVALRLPDIDVSPASVLRSAGPGSLIDTWLQSMTMTFERYGDTPGPVILHTTEPAKLVAHLTQFPPPIVGAPYYSQGPVSFAASPDSSAPAHVQLQGFDVILAA